MNPVKIALLGAGRRAHGVYFNVLPRLREHFELAAVCDPVPEYADKAAGRMGVPGFTSLRELVAAGVVEAAIICSPPESHHAISLLLSRHGINHICETPMAMTLRQCREMAAAAAENGVVLHINEQFFREEVIAMARLIVAEGVIGDVHRMTWFHGHTGYHNNSIWQVLAGGAPEAVNAIRHTMPVHRHLDGASRWQETETYRLRVMHFPGGLLVTDSTANVKSAMGRYPRPGYLEIDGTEGAIIAQAYDGRPAPWNGRAEVRLVAEEDYTRGAYAESYPIERITMVGHRINISEQLPHNGEVHALRVKLPRRTLTYENPMLEYGLGDHYLATVAESTLDFLGGVRGEEREFTIEMAVTSGEMEAAFARSVAAGGARVALPVPAEEGPGEIACLEALRKKYGVDPMDGEAMLEIAFPINYVSGGRSQG